MTTHLDDQLRAYGDYLSERLVAHVTEPADGIRSVRLAPSDVWWRSRRIVGVTVAAVAVFALGVTSLLMRPGPESDSAAPAPTSAPVAAAGFAEPADDALVQPGPWCGRGVPVGPRSYADGEDVAWAPDGSRWEIDVRYQANTSQGEGTTAEWTATFLQTRPDGTIVEHPLPTIDDFELPSWYSPDSVVDLRPFDVEVAADGGVWLSGASEWIGSTYGVLRFDPVTSTWQNVPILDRAIPVVAIEATCDGAVWMLTVDWIRVDDRFDVVGWWLARVGLDGSVATVEPDLSPGTLPSYPAPSEGWEPAVLGPPSIMAVNEQGLWLAQGTWLGGSSGTHLFPGVALFDGERWTRFLDGRLVVDLVVTDDGDVRANTVSEGGLSSWVVMDSTREAE